MNLDDEEARIILAFRRVRDTGSEFADVLVKIHDKKLVAIHVTDKWHPERKNVLKEPNR